MLLAINWIHLRLMKVAIHRGKVQHVVGFAMRRDVGNVFNQIKDLPALADRQFSNSEYD